MRCRRPAPFLLSTLLLLALGGPLLAADADVWDRVEHNWAQNEGVKIHYVTLGKGEGIEADYTLVTIPTSGHWVQSEASEMVSATMKAWLAQRSSP